MDMLELYKALFLPSELWVVLPAIPIFFFSLFYFLKAFTHFNLMIKNLKHPNAMMLLGVFSLFFASLYNEKGNYHRIEFLKCMGVFLAICGVFVIVILIKHSWDV